ncbi:hypothetical protein UFOVP1244_44 [uncultured Caudovirales phage]|uniref:LT_GEWL domain containing protein n=1 Tax=uncultured Caudovirales phage TaxID=2100421 RepID=A0A6J5R5K0_9CAUD|nr:hypothetical protein UFOVP1244_44 [uncultured Caudovirales phage]
MPIGFYGPLSASAGMLDASGPSPYPTNIRNIMGAGLAGYLSGAPLDAEDQRKKQAQEALGKIGNVVQTAWQSTAAPLAKQSGVSMAYLDSRARAESGNRNIPQSVNPKGSAFGPFQFTEGTWNDLINRHPDLGLSPQDRFDPAAQGKAVVSFTSDNADALKAGGVPVGPLQLALAHQFGANGALAILKAKPKTSIGAILPDAVAANPQWADMTAEDIIGATQKQQSGKGGNQAAAQEQTAGGGGLLADSTTPVTSGRGLADLLGGGGYTPPPFGAGLENMTPQMREIMKIAIQDPTLGPGALNALFQVAGGTGTKGQVTPAEAARLAVEMQGQQSREQQGGKKLEFMKKQLEQSQQNQSAMQQYRENEQKFQQDKLRMEMGMQGLTHEQKQQEIAAQKDRLDWEKAKTEAEGVQKMAVDTWNNAIKGADEARTNLDNIGQLEALGKKISTGKFAGNAKDILSVAQSLGIDTKALGIDESAGPLEAYQAISSNMAMHLRNPPGQSNLMPGQMSNYEDQLLQKMGPQLSTSPQGNAIMIAINRRINERARDFSQFAADYSGPKDQKWIQAAQQWWQRPENQLRTPEFEKKLDSLTNPPNSATPTEEAPNAASISSMSLKELGEATKKFPSMLTDPATSSIIRQKLGM